MDILQDAGYETPVVVVKRQWGLDKYDLKKYKRILKKLVKGKIEYLSNAAIPPAIARRNAIMHQLTTYRDHLIGQEGRAVATTVFERAIEIVRAIGEPILEGDDWVDLNDACILIVDDVADTGHTLELVRNSALAEVAEVRSAVLYQKPHSVVDCEYVWAHTDRWINFPWSTEPPVVDISQAKHQVLDA